MRRVASVIRLRPERQAGPAKHLSSSRSVMASADLTDVLACNLATRL